MRRLLLLIVLGLVGFVAFRIFVPAGPAKPGEAEFREANRLISVNRGTVAFGNDEPARALAARYSTLLKAITQAAFTGGKASSMSTSKGEVLVYCQARADGYVLLAHVPELRQYHDDVRDALSGLAWSAAQELVPDKSRKLVVGLRGAVLYGPIWSGSGSSAPSMKVAGTGAMLGLYPYFIPATGGPAAAP